MSPELAQWITPAILVCGFLYLVRSIRSVRVDLRAEMGDLRADFKDLRAEFKDLRDHVDRQIGDLRDHVDQQFGDLRDRMGRVEGALDVLRDFFVRNGRGTAA